MTFVFNDFETQSDLDLTIVGTLNYVLNPSTRILLFSYAVDDAPVGLYVPDMSAEMDPQVWNFIKSKALVGTCPAVVHEIMGRDDGYMVAWNAAFDRAVWKQIGVSDNMFPNITIQKTLCAMNQACASNLPAQLDQAGRALGIGSKTLGGKAVMKRFADRKQPLPGSHADVIARAVLGHVREKIIADALEAWGLYMEYAVQDTALMRDIWNVTRMLDVAEWTDYWVSERINDRGMMIDTEICAAAITYREEDANYIVNQCKELTDGAIQGPTFTAKINEWLYSQLPHDLQEIMVKERDELTDEPTRLSGAKNIMTLLLEEIQQCDVPPSDKVLDFIELMQYGRASSSVKFEKMLNQQVDGRLTNSYRSNGAGQTGRFSSVGVQIHNLVRAKLPNELDVLDKLVARTPIEQLRFLPMGDKPDDIERAARGATAIAPILSRCLRPTFIAPEGRRLVWGDWSAIEARVNPWLASSRDADAAVLRHYRDGTDLYIVTAMSIFGFRGTYEEFKARVKAKDPEATDMRGAGKIAVLALGFLGAGGALRNMARNYGMVFSDEQMERIVGRWGEGGWRGANGWAKRFGDQLETAAFDAMNSPGSYHNAGKITYQFVPELTAGTLVCYLPDKRPIVYPVARIAKVEKFGKERDAITYLNGHARRALWNGLQIENVTQATAASLLRATLVKIELNETEADLVGHTHDEAILEADTADADAVEARLEKTMVEGFEWSEGLPLAADTTQDWYYHK